MRIRHGAIFGIRERAYAIPRDVPTNVQRRVDLDRKFRGGHYPEVPQPSGCDSDKHRQLLEVG